MRASSPSLLALSQLLESHTKQTQCWLKEEHRSYKKNEKHLQSLGPLLQALSLVTFSLAMCSGLGGPVGQRAAFGRFQGKRGWGAR